MSYTSGTTTIRRSIPFEIFQRLRKSYQIKVFDEFLRKNSSEIEEFKNCFIPTPTKKKFDVILIFNKNYKFNVIKNFFKKKCLIIDINNYYKIDCLKSNIKYKSLEYEN